MHQENQKIEKKLLKKLKSDLKNCKLCILAVSGGPDSIFLAEIFSKSDELKQKSILFHLNHNLRKSSSKEENFVKKYAEEKNYKLISKSEEIKKLAQEKNENLENFARKKRYELLSNEAKKRNASYILTAHHADDNLESILLAMTRGSSLKGLSGIKEKRKLKETTLYRPLLNISKKRILNYLKEQKISFCIDESNQDTTYKRNFLRHEIIPKLKKLNPNLVQTIANNAKDYQEIDSDLREKAILWLEKNSINKFTLDAKKLRKEKTYFIKYILLEFYKEIKGNSLNISQKQLEEVIKIIKKNVGNKKTKLSSLYIELNSNKLKIS